MGVRNRSLGTGGDRLPQAARRVHEPGGSGINFAATWTYCEGVAEAFPSQRRSNHTRTVRRRRAAREGGTTGRDAWRWLTVWHSLGGRGTVADRVGGSLRPEREPSRCRGRGGSWRVIEALDSRSTLKPTLLPLLGAGRGWGTFNLGEAALRPAPPHRSHADQPALERSGGVCGSGWHERSEKERQRLVTGGAADGRLRHSQRSGWTGAACAGACEERAATSR
jgi:hypothetical protein